LLELHDNSLLAGPDIHCGKKEAKNSKEDQSKHFIIHFKLG
jgi:hypothetical protein